MILSGKFCPCLSGDWRVAISTPSIKLGQRNGCTLAKQVLQLRKQDYQSHALPEPTAGIIDLKNAEDELLKAQSADKGETYSLADTQVLVQTAMFAAVGGLAYSIAEVLKLQGYVGYLLPMPIVLSAMHFGPKIARKTLVATCMLLLVLLGPLQATGYFLQHGCAAWALGSLWAAGVPWLPSIFVSGLARMAGIVAYLVFTSWTLNENVYRLLVTKIASLLDQMGAIMGISGSPSLLLIQGVMFSFLLVNCLMYVGLLHVLYAILLRSMGYKTMRMPAFLEKRLLPAQYHAAS